MLYLDESGNPGGADDRYFVLAGISAYEQNTYFLARDVDAIKQKYFPTTPPLDFHASRIRAGIGFWRHVDKPTRDNVLADIGNVIAASAGAVRLFGSVVEKSAILHGDAAVKIAMEQVCKRFDIMLKRQFNEHGEAQRGLLVFAESNYQARAKLWVQGFRELGTQWGVLKNLSDIPYFVPAKESRLIQLADYVAHALYLLYEKKRRLPHAFDNPSIRSERWGDTRTDARLAEPWTFLRLSGVFQQGPSKEIWPLAALSASDSGESRHYRLRLTHCS